MVLLLCNDEHAAPYWTNTTFKTKIGAIPLQYRIFSTNPVDYYR